MLCVQDVGCVGHVGCVGSVRHVGRVRCVGCVGRALTVDVDEHVLDGALSQGPHTGHTVQRTGMIRFGPVDGETTCHII